jgi:prepilin-type N-terminal cleavage/methylation domain-containing protein
MTQSAHIARHARGFTLIEVIITLVIAGVLATIGATLMSSGFRSYFLGRELAQDAAQGTLALERMTRDLRAVRSAADLTTIGASTISFVDVDGNTITYALSAGSVTRSQNGGTAQPVAANVSSLAFTYLQNDGQTTAASSATVWYIVVAVTVTSQNVGTTFRGTVKPASF